MRMILVLWFISAGFAHAAPPVAGPHVEQLLRIYEWASREPDKTLQLMPLEGREAWEFEVCAQETSERESCKATGIIVGREALIQQLRRLRLEASAALIHQGTRQTPQAMDATINSTAGCLGAVAPLSLALLVAHRASAGRLQLAENITSAAIFITCTLGARFLGDWLRLRPHLTESYDRERTRLWYLHDTARDLAAGAEQNLRPGEGWLIDFEGHDTDTLFGILHWLDLQVTDAETRSP